MRLIVTYFFLLFSNSLVQCGQRVAAIGILLQQ